MIKVNYISPTHFEELLKSNLTSQERKAVHEMKIAQTRYARLTVKRFIYFWLIYNKYNDLELPIQQQINKAYGEIREPRKKYYALKSRKK